MSKSSRSTSWALGAIIVMTALPAQAQSNLDAGKSPAQIFADTCAACHRAPRELKPTSAAFLRQHYTTGTQEAMTMAAYLAAIGSDPRAVQQRRPPGAGAGRGAPTEPATARGGTPPAAGDRGRQPETPAATPAGGNGRRTPGAPEQAQSAPGAAAKPAAADVQEHGNEPASQAAAAPTRSQPLEEFEE